MRTRGFLVGLLVIAAGAGAGACSSGSPSGEASQDAGTVAHIKVFAFRPNPLKVPVGAKVTWVNEDDITHTVTSGTREYAPGDTGKLVATKKDGMFDLALEGAGKRASFTFSAPGTFHYFCDRHPGMEADVIVS